ncbi:MAG: hypothetical protein JWN56_367 [Sphingobacteriales bacterium]|nr:hypothetical protein [Sphingobacteriales bacterium]
MHQDLLMTLKGVTPEEYVYLEQIMNGMDRRQAQNFIMFYSGKRRTAQDILLFTLLGFVVVAGVQRFVIGQIGMGILYLLTCGLCFIGTIVDIINHRSLASEYNRTTAYECAQMVSIMNNGGQKPTI